MKIIKAIIFQFKTGIDIVHLNTDLPSSHPEKLKGNLTLAFEVEKGKGKEYLDKHFEFVDKDPTAYIVYIDGDK